MSDTPNLGLPLMEPSQNQPHVIYNEAMEILDGLPFGGGGSAGSGLYIFQLSLSDLTTDLSTGTSVAYFRAPVAFTIDEVRSSLKTAGSSTTTVDINKNGSTILSTKLTIDSSEKTSVTAATPAVLSSTSVSSDDELTFDIDAAGPGAKGLIVTIIGY